MKFQTPPKTQYRILPWLDLKNGMPVYGIQQKRPGSKWVNCALDGKPLLYGNRELAKKHLRWLKDPQGTAPEWDQNAVA